MHTVHRWTPLRRECFHTEWPRQASEHRKNLNGAWLARMSTGRGGLVWRWPRWSSPLLRRGENTRCCQQRECRVLEEIQVCAHQEEGWTCVGRVGRGASWMGTLGDLTLGGKPGSYWWSGPFYGPLLSIYLASPTHVGPRAGAEGSCFSPFFFFFCLERVHI